MTAKNLALATITATGTIASRSFGDFHGDIFNVKSFGALGDGSGALLSSRFGSLGAAQAVYPFVTTLSDSIDWAAIQAAVNAMYLRANKSCILFFPPGNFNITSTIDISNNNVGSNFVSGIIRGSGRWATFISGNIPTGFIFSQTDGINGPEEISTLSLVNTSTVIGTGALFVTNSGMRVTNCHFSGMTLILMPYNIYQMSIDNCTGETNSDVTTGYTGTFGIAGYHCNVEAWRIGSPMQAGLQFFGSNTAVVGGCGIENCTVAYVAGMATGWASQCTVSGTTLTVGGNLGSGTFVQFAVGGEIFMKGVTTTADWGILPLTGVTLVAQLSGTPGFAGTYQISRSATVASPVPCISRRLTTLGGTHFEACTSEACYYIATVYGVSGVTFTGLSGSATVNECVSAMGTTGFAATAGVYIGGGSGGTSFIDCTPSSNPTLASWYFDPAGSESQISFLNCTGSKVTDGVTGTTSSISNGSGGAGTILNVLSLTAGNFVGIGCRVFVSGVQVAKIIGNQTTEGTLTGSAGLGTYRVDTSQLVTGQAITIKWGDDWVLPTTSSAKTGLQFYNCTSANLPAGYVTGLNNLGRTFTSLPGQTGANNNFPVVEGMLYYIVDGAKSGGGTALPGDATQGGGSQKIFVFWNGTSWIRT